MAAQNLETCRTPGHRRFFVLVLLFVAAVAVPAAAGPVLHEYFKPTAGEDLELGAVAPGGRIPAAIPGTNRPVRAPDVNRDPYSSRTTYGGAKGAAGDRSAYKIDRATSRPSSVTYHEPFIPSIAPFKRLLAYDALDENLGLVVGDTMLSPINVGGAPAEGEDQFYGDLAVELIPGTPVRIPSVGPGARILAANLSPAVPYRLFRDVADNWFVQASTRQRVRLTLQLAIARAAFGGSFSEGVSYGELQPMLPQVPRSAQRATARVMAHIGIAPAMPPREALALLVHYFRSFVPSNEYPTAVAGPALYEELSMSQKGVCRHRAYGFVVTALALGIPSRMVMNEAHAWVEVFDGMLWNRVDLGGAADDVVLEQESRFEPYPAPNDPFDWPDSAESGEAMVDRARGVGARGASRIPAQDRPATEESIASGAGPGSEAPERLANRPEARIQAQTSVTRIVRGRAIRMQGTYRSRSGPCAQARIDVLLAGLGRDPIHIQSIPTSAQGRFDHEVTVPVHVPVGEYTIELTSPGTVSCAAAPPE